ncbi:MAG: DUF1016 N-terminal domain-containing protein [Eubacteriales bacterium]
MNMDEIKKEIMNIKPTNEEMYLSIRARVVNAQCQVYRAVNSAMVLAYHEIGEQIYIACGESDRAEYGKNLLKYISEQLTAEFGKGFDITNLRKMRRFYLMFPIRDTLCLELSWSHYRTLMKISDEENRNWYMEECVKSNWSVRQLERQINTMFRERLVASRDKKAVAAEVFEKEVKPEYETIVKLPVYFKYKE